jgi:putative oxidoreductase
MDAGLLGVRLIIGLVLVVHATQKWRGWFNGPGFESSVIVFVFLGQLPARAMVQVAVTMELIAAALLLAGFATPLGAVIAAATMGVAGAAVYLASGSLASAKGGGEYALVLALVSMTIGMTGPGLVSADRLLDAPWADGLPAWGVVLCVIVPIAAAAPAVHRTRRNLAAAAASAASSATTPTQEDT